MKQSFRILSLLIVVIFLFPGCQKLQQDELGDNRKSVLIDSDMVEAFDDGVAFMILLGSDDIEIEGLTTVTGNVWAQEALAYGIRIGELCGGKDLTYIGGSQYPMRPERLDSFKKEVDANPGQDASYLGALSFPTVNDWSPFYEQRYGRKPEIRPSSEDASEYIARQILSAPGQLTILAIGPCTNIAKALVSHPEIASETKEIIYMGGAVWCDGNTTPYAEMNFLYDPEAAAICLRAPFPKQTIVSLDVCNTVKMDRQQFMAVYQSVHSEELKKLFRGNYAYQMFEEDPSATQYVWDLISAAIAIDSDIISEYKDVRLDVDDNPDSPTYGKVYETQSSSRQIVRVPLQINQERFWDIITSRLSKY
ncbi:MAG: nucleoside hydrolase [Bacteroidaceae bacterium]|nr:nucleoside hydrolase [Bacteroidaceae bacterium]